MLGKPGGSHLVSEEGKNFFLEVSEIRGYNDLQINRRCPEVGSAYECKKTR